MSAFATNNLDDAVDEPRRRPAIALAVVGGSLVVSAAALAAFGILNTNQMNNPANQIDDEQDATAISRQYPDTLLLPLPPTATPSYRPSIRPSASSLPSQSPSTSASPSSLPSSVPSYSVNQPRGLVNLHLLHQDPQIILHSYQVLHQALYRQCGQLFCLAYPNLQHFILRRSPQRYVLEF